MSLELDNISNIPIMVLVKKPYSELIAFDRKKLLEESFIVEKMIDGTLYAIFPEGII
jgi:hypothetical protein